MSVTTTSWWNWKRVEAMDGDSGDDGNDDRAMIGIEKSQKKNDQDKVDGTRQEFYSKGNMHNEMSDL